MLLFKRDTTDALQQTFNITIELDIICDILIVGGGGGGGTDQGGGGGAGTVICIMGAEIIAGSYDLIIGNGGAGGVGGAERALNQGSNGNYSSAFGFVARGGGGGGGPGYKGSSGFSYTKSGKDGGSGGGAPARKNATSQGGSSTIGVTMDENYNLINDINSNLTWKSLNVYGNKGGNDDIIGEARGGGGGGAGEPGKPASAFSYGGDGIQIAFGDTNYYWGGGGGGCIFRGSTPNGVKGGGGGGAANGMFGTGGINNGTSVIMNPSDILYGWGGNGGLYTGGGGGGAHTEYYGNLGGTGSSGIIIINYTTVKILYNPSKFITPIYIGQNLVSSEFSMKADGFVNFYNDDLLNVDGSVNATEYKVNGQRLPQYTENIIHDNNTNTTDGAVKSFTGNVGIETIVLKYPYRATAYLVTFLYDVECDIMILAGGGGGAGKSGGGGGAGGLIYAKLIFI